MRVRALWTLAFLAIAGTAIADDSWKSFRFEDDRFAIDFPDPPLTTNQGFNAGTMVRTHQYYVGIKSYTFMVSATLFRYEARDEIGGDKRLLRLLIDIFVANCASHGERPVLIRGAAAREVHAENCERGPATMVSGASGKSIANRSSSNRNDFQLSSAIAVPAIARKAIVQSARTLI